MPGSPTRAALVVQPSALASVRQHLEMAPMPVEFFVQQEPTGMLDAILLARRGVERVSAAPGVDYLVRPDCAASGDDRRTRDGR